MFDMILQLRFDTWRSHYSEIEISCLICAWSTNAMLLACVAPTSRIESNSFIANDFLEFVKGFPSGGWTKDIYIKPYPSCVQAQHIMWDFMLFCFFCEKYQTMLVVNTLVRIMVRIMEICLYHMIQTFSLLWYEHPTNSMSMIRTMIRTIVRTRCPPLKNQWKCLVFLRIINWPVNKAIHHWQCFIHSIWACLAGIIDSHQSPSLVRIPDRFFQYARLCHQCFTFDCWKWIRNSIITAARTGGARWAWIRARWVRRFQLNSKRNKDCRSVHYHLQKSQEIQPLVHQSRKCLTTNTDQPTANQIPAFSSIWLRASCFTVAGSRSKISPKTHVFGS